MLQLMTSLSYVKYNIIIQNCTQNQVLNDILVSHGLGDFKFLTLSLIFKVFYSAFPKKLTNNSQPNVKHRGPSQICSYLNQTIKIHLQVQNLAYNISEIFQPSSSQLPLSQLVHFHLDQPYISLVTRSPCVELCYPQHKIVKNKPEMKPGRRQK